MEKLETDFSDEIWRATLQEFLNDGWFLSLPSSTPDNQKILIGWGEWSERSIRPSEADSGPAVFAPDFYLREPKPWRQSRHWAIVDRNLFASHVLAANERNVKSKDQGFQWVEPSQAQFEIKWRAIRDGMRDRGLKKAVPVVFSESDVEFGVGFGPDRRLQVLANLVQAPRQLQLYGSWKTDSGGRSSGQSSGHIGATPEILFSQTDPEFLQTMALAGTRIREPGAAAALLADPKERKEHEIVVSDLRKVLSPISEVDVSETGILELPSLIHLHTAVHSQLLRPVEFMELVQLLHPTPALGLSPRHLGQEEMLRWDDIDRGGFGAPFGVELELPDGEMIRHCVVAIRGIQWQDNRIRVGSGCGIVPESDFDREWQELERKRESVKRMLQI